MVGEPSSNNAGAVLDEVALLEAALQDALERRRCRPSANASVNKSTVGTATATGSPFACDGRNDLRVIGTEVPASGSSNFTSRGAAACGVGGGISAGAGMAAMPPLLPVVERFDAATAAYGMQLKSWIDLQVDQRLSQVVQSGLLQGEFLNLQRESVASLERHMDMEIEKVKSTQSRLLEVVQTVSEELVRVQAQGDALETVEKALEKVMVTVEELQNHIALQEGAGRSRSLEQSEDPALAELRNLQEAMHERHESDRARSDQLHNEAIEWQRQCRQELAEHANAFLEGREEVSDLVRMMQELERKVAASQTDVKLEVSEELRAMHAKSLPGDQGLNEVEARLVARIQAQFEATGAELVALAATKADIQNIVDNSQFNLKEELVTLQKRLVAELRAETTAAFRSESASVAALDEQLWLTDQRLGQRIDELAHAHQECVTVVERRAGKERAIGVPELSGIPTHERALRTVESIVDRTSLSSPRSVATASEVVANGGSRHLSNGGVTMAREAAETLAEHLEMRRSGTSHASADKVAGGMESANPSNVASATSLRSAIQANPRSSDYGADWRVETVGPPSPTREAREAEDARTQLAAELERPLRTSHERIAARARKDAAGSAAGGRFPFRRAEATSTSESTEVFAEDMRISSHFPALRLGQRT